MEFCKLEVGQPYELFTGRDLKGQTGCIFEVFHGGSYILNIYLNNITKEEKLLLRKGKIKTKIITEGNNLLTLLEFGSNTDFIFEMSFDPTLYRDGRILDLFNSNMLLIVGVESNDNTIQILRQVSVPLKLFQLWLDTWKKTIMVDNYSKQYKEWMDNLEYKYSMIDLWKMGLYMGKMGQQEDIDLVNYLNK